MAYVKIRPRRSTPAEWEYDNPILAEGEMGVEVPVTGVGTGFVNIKFGDGVTPWIDLPYGVKSGYTGGGSSEEEVAQLTVRVTALETFVSTIRPRLVLVYTDENARNTFSVENDIEALAEDSDYSTVELQQLDARVTVLEEEIASFQTQLLLIDDTD